MPPYTGPYRAPELSSRMRASPQQESFAFGVTLVEAATGSKMFPTVQSAMSYTDVQQPALLQQLHGEVRFALLHFLRTERSSRITLHVPGHQNVAGQAVCLQLGQWPCTESARQWRSSKTICQLSILCKAVTKPPCSILSRACFTWSSGELGCALPGQSFGLSVY